MGDEVGLMGNIIKRGAKDSPRFYIRYVDIDGVRRCRAVKGATTKLEAQRVLNAHELKVASDRAGIIEDVPSLQAQLDSQSEMLAHVLDLLVKLADNIVHIRDKPESALTNAIRKYKARSFQRAEGRVHGLYQDSHGRFRIDLRWFDVHTMKRERLRQVLPMGTTTETAAERALEILNRCISGKFTKEIKCQPKR